MILEKTICPDCRGEGNRQAQCSRCRSFGGRDCAACGNSGVVDLGPCGRCKQTGMIEAEDFTDDELAEAEEMENTEKRDWLDDALADSPSTIWPQDGISAEAKEAA